MLLSDWGREDASLAPRPPIGKKKKNLVSGAHSRVATLIQTKFSKKKQNLPSGDFVCTEPVLGQVIVETAKSKNGDSSKGVPSRVVRFTSFY